MQVISREAFDGLFLWVRMCATPLMLKLLQLKCCPQFPPCSGHICTPRFIWFQPEITRPTVGPFLTAAPQDTTGLQQLRGSQGTAPL